LIKITKKQQITPSMLNRRLSSDFGVCTIPVVQTFRTSNDCLFPITIVSYSCFILRDPYSNYNVRRDHEDKNVHGRKGSS
jgi:hypothetical protein